MSNTFEDFRSNFAETEWQFWCRLCAKDDVRNINIYAEQKQTPVDTNELVDFIAEFFKIHIRQNENLPHWLCAQCFSSVSTLSKFTNQVNRVQSMYHEIQNSGHRKAEDFRVIREKYKLLGYELYLLNISDTKPSIENIFVADAPEIIEHKSLDSIIKSEVITDELQSGIFLKDIEFNSEFQDPIGDAVENLSNEVGSSERLSKYNSEFQDPIGAVENHTNKVDSTEFPSNSIKDNNSEVTSKVYSKIHRLKKRKSSSDEESNVNKHFCNDCTLHFKKSSNYLIHMRKKHGVETLPSIISCPQCSRTFKSKFNLKRHLKIHRPVAEKKIYPCPQCDRKFQTKDYVFRHIKFVHEEIRPFICEECGEGTHTETTLREHMLKHTDYAPFECEICKKGFKTQARLKNHMEMHSEHKHICSECGLELNSRITLNRHMLVHSDEMRHKCDYCGREFKRAKTLKTHLILHSGLKPYSCGFCDKTFASGSNCRTHKRKSHPEELAALEASGEKKFTKNIPKLAVLKTVTRTAENLLPVVSKQSGNFSFGKKPKPPSSCKDETKQCIENKT
ncbi:zinc finger protein 2-like [Bactrocera tryoni]|uniref:zinc finger protein 2-like n=1 Tax=Bactrocera tryoni TaxID=59916 RepID=UPI001A965B06|nr:zinc finger protein 2-like [Bactrocera tryoni]